MTTYSRHVLAFAILVGFAMPAAAQSANRTQPGVPNAPQAVTALVPEPASTARCRAHCASLAATAPHAVQQHQSVADRQAKSAGCIRNMAK